jgi:prophage antirepressor-like protein
MRKAIMTKIEKFSNDDLGFEAEAIHLDDKLLVSAKHVAQHLEYSKTSHMMELLEEDEVVRIPRKDLGMGPGSAIPFLTESGLYHATFMSRLPAAKAYRKWVTSEVLPTLRKTGLYVDPNSDRTDEQLEAELQRQLEKRKYKVVVRDILKGLPGTKRQTYSTIQDQVYLWVCGMTARELVNSGREIQTWSGKNGPTKADRETGKNYLYAEELRKMESWEGVVENILLIHRPQTHKEFDKVLNEAVRTIENFQL